MEHYLCDVMEGYTMSPKMKALEGDMLGFRIYINPREAKNERPHVHLSTGKGVRANDLKVWLDTLKISNTVGEFSDKEVTDGVAVVRLNKPILMARYKEMHGETLERPASVRKAKKTNKRRKARK